MTTCSEPQTGGGRASLLALACLTILALTSAPTAACDFCFPEGAGPSGPASSGPHFLWTLKDSLAACPAGDSLIIGGHAGHPHPSRLRMEVWYNDANCTAKPDIPPDSIWVTYTTLEGTAVVNDKAVKVFADDSTDICGHTWITIPSFSGCGKVRFTLRISGVSKGSKTVVVRTTDTNADGRTTAADLSSACDIDYNGQAGGTSDLAQIQQHLQHWDRLALHGTLVARTSLCDNCALGAANTLGESDVSWSPDDANLAFTIFVRRDSASQSSDDCHVFHVPSDPKSGNTPTHFSFPPFGIHDYDPSWSPVGDQIAFDREDNRIIRKGIPGINPDTTEKLVTAGDVGQFHRGAVTPAFSPDAKWIAFSLKDQTGQTGHSDLWIVSLDDTSQKKRLTTNLNAFYPQWSPDGQWILFDELPDPGQHRARRVRPFLNPVPPPEDLLSVAATLHAATPASSPDSLVVALGVGGTDISAHTIDPLLGPSQSAIGNFPDQKVSSGVTILTLASRMSSDGTRLALRARRPGLPSSSRPQLWAARRNMSLPPVFSPPLPTNPVVVAAGNTYQLTVSATDPENDAIAYSAFFLQLGMTFDPAPRVFSWTPPASSGGKTYHVKFLATTASGGSDSHVLRIKVTAPGAGRQSADRGMPGSPGLANPSAQGFALYAPAIAGERAVLEVFDVSGRRVARVFGPSGSVLAWDGRDHDGTKAAVGIYLYRLRVGTSLWRGKWVLVR